MASQERDLLAQLADTLTTAGLEVQRTADVAGVELAPAARARTRAARPSRLRRDRLACVDKAELDRQFSELYRAHLRTSTPTPTTAWATTTTPRTSPSRPSCRPTGTSSARVRESDGRPLRPWLIRIAHNLAANLYRDRSRKPQTPIEDTGTLRTTHTTEDLVEGRDELARILEGVKELPDDRREALIMRFALGMDNREIARAMGRTDGATKVLIHRAIKQLEEIVAARQGGPD